jgi:uncharacterized protein with FMN-binding domain
MPWNTTGEKVRLVVLATAITGAIYAVGYSAADTGGVLAFSRSQAERDLTPLAGPGRYRDGLYSGSASNMYGTVTVELTILSGRIRHLSITGCSTFFPQTYIDGLPPEVLRAQSANVPLVSGATGSWQDFVQAVQEALGSAVAKANGGPR